MITLNNVSLFVGGKLLIADATFQVSAGDRTALVGRNGSGKSHLMELLAKKTEPDAGEVNCVPGVRVLLVGQTLPSATLTPIEFLRDQDPEIRALEQKIEACNPQDMADLSEALTTIDDERYTVLAPRILTGLGITEEEMALPMDKLSGGKRMRVGMAIVLVRMPQVLLLDEPTNHLDLESTQWLIAFLKQYPKTSAIVMITHDKRLMKEVSTSTLHLRQGDLTHFKGTYDQYRATLALQESRDRGRNAELEKQIARHKEIYMRFRKLPAKRAAQAVAQLKRAEMKEDDIVEIPTEAPVVPFEFVSPTCLQSPIVKFTRAKLGYGTQCILTVTELTIAAQEKIGLLGRNGQGKTTLVRSIIGTLPLLSGVRDCDARLKVGYFSQDLMETLNPDFSVAEQFMHATGIRDEQNVRTALASYGFPHDKIQTRIQDLSGGEKARLLFLIIKSCAPQLIVLDEPTNDLDMESREALIAAIKTYNGPMVIISHDADLLEETVNALWLVNKGRVQVYPGTLKTYQEQLQTFVSHLTAPPCVASKSVFRPPAAAASSAPGAQPRRARQ